jgi:hypothetical protein
MFTVAVVSGPAVAGLETTIVVAAASATGLVLAAVTAESVPLAERAIASTRHEAVSGIGDLF